MNERDLWWKIVIVGGLVALAFASVYPIEQKMKFGIDLAGGYSLLYEIDDTGLSGSAKADLNKRVMKVLYKRVDPKGVFNLVWRPVGHNRLEIQMPRPSKEVIKARRNYEQHQEALRNTLLRRSQVLAAVSKPPEERAIAFAKLTGKIKPRLALLASAAKAYDEMTAMQKAYDLRVQKIKQNNLSQKEVLEAVKTPAGERAAAIELLIRGNPERKALLEAAARAWDETQAAQSVASQPAAEGPTSRPGPKVLAAKKRAFDQAVRKVLKTNVDPNKLTSGATIDEVIRLEEVFDGAVGKVVETNVDIGRLQTLLEMKKKDKARASGIKELISDHPNLADLIKALVEDTDQLQQHRRGEGRLEDPADLQRLLKGAGVLDFRILPQNDRSNPEFDAYRERLKKRGPRPSAGEEKYQWFEIEDPANFLRIDKRKLEVEFEQRKASLGVVAERFGDKYYVLAHIGEAYTMTHTSKKKDWTLKSASFSRDRNGMPAIGFTLDTIGGSKFGRLTQRNKQKQLCIFLDDKAISNATIQATITTNGIITGRFTPSEVHEMVKKLNAGSLPQKLKDPPISVRSIGPSLGKANREAGLSAAKYGAICVAIFMLIYYFYAGAIAVVAVAFNILFIGAMMSLTGATLTLPGIAGLVLAIGMAVDANVLINERIREELERGTAVRMAFRFGYERAFRAILDSNVTTILTCVILYMVGTEEIKGFGLTLGIGVFINIFTAYFITRIFFALMVMVSIPREVIRYPIYTALGVSAFGGLLYGLGYWLINPAMRDASVSMAFGRSLIDVAPSILGLMVLLFLARLVHGNRSGLPMLKLIGAPKFDWVGHRYYFFGLSVIMIIASLLTFVSVSKNDLFDIEFLGGTSAQIDLKTPGALDQTEISKRLERSSETLKGYSQAMATATISGSDSTFTIDCPGVPAGRLEPMIKEVLRNDLSLTNAITYEDPAAQKVEVNLKADSTVTAEQLKAALVKGFDQAADAIKSSQVQAITGVEGAAVEGKSFEIVTREPSKEIVVEAITENLEKDIDIQPKLSFKLLSNKQLGGVDYFPILESDPQSLGIKLSPTAAASIDLENWVGGVCMVLERVSPPQSIKVLQSRLKAMRLQPGFEKYGWRVSTVFGLTPDHPGSDLYKRLMVVVLDENYPIENDQGSLSSTWQSMLAEPEVELLQAALSRQTSLSHVTQFDRQVSGEAQIQAYLALALSWLLIIIYVWFRFGNIRWGFAAVVALIHDVTIALGCVVGTHFIAQTPLGTALMIDRGFRIDLGLVAALLTVIGYSVNDTIVVFDRIRENRGRLTELTPDMINSSISQTLSRTLLTFLTSMISVIIMYTVGGRGIHSFTFVLMVGLTVGTYSSIGVASQFLLRRKQWANA